MTSLLGLASHAERSLLPTLSRLSANDIDGIWGHVADYIGRQMTSQKGVHLAGLGTFSFSQLKLDVGNKLVVIQRPIFLLAEKLVRTQNLRHNRPLATATHVPVVALNYAAVSQAGPFQREVVEGCVRETLLLLPRALASGSPAHLALRGVGTLSVKNNQVAMKFHRDFVKTLDSTGGFLLALSNVERPGSSVSLTSGRLTPAGSIRLPSVASPQRGAPSGAGNGHGALVGPGGAETPGAPGPKDPRPGRPESSEKPSRPEPLERPGRPESSEKPGRPEPLERPGRPESSERSGRPESSVKPGRPEPPERSGRPEPPERSGRPEPLERPGRPEPSERPGRPEPPERPGRPEPSESPGVHRLHLSRGPESSGHTRLAAKTSSVSFSSPEGVLTEEEPHRDTRCTGHIRAGQELCHLCMQRAQRNVPLHLRDERRAEEVEQGVLLHLRGQQEEQLYLQGEQAQLGQQRAFSEQVAAFNLGASQTLREQRAQKPQFHGSYLFAQRPLTAALRGAGQRGHEEELRDQLVNRRTRRLLAQQERLLLEKVDQAQLAHEIALQRKQQFLQKQQRVDHYRRALDLQVERGKATSPQDQQPIGTGIGRCETAATANENRERAQKVSQEQLMAATQKRREDVSRRRTQQQTEREMLSRNRKEFILDRLARFEATKGLRASLEDTWRTSARLKVRRDEDEKSFRRFGGNLLLDQGERYRRCHQCKRKPGNHGESNIWRESSYTSGSRLMM